VAIRDVINLHHHSLYRPTIAYVSIFGISTGSIRPLHCPPNLPNLPANPIVISKRIIIGKIVEQLTEQLATLAGASRAMHADASDEQNKAEDKYDTRGLESAYLASSQARLATEAEQALATYQMLELLKFPKDTPIDVTALVELDCQGESVWYFLGPKSGGMEIRHNGTEVLVITPESPLGQQLIGKKLGDRIQFQTRGPAQEFRVISVS
jgi:hypothetical protein